MTEKVKFANEAIINACKGRVLSESDYFFIPIKDDKIIFAKNLNEIEDADECMLFLPSYWDNTVKNKYGPGTVTFRNPIHVLVYIDSQKTIHDYYTKDNFQILCSSRWGDCNSLFLYYHGYNSVELLETGATEEGFKRIWECYQAAKKCLKTQREELESAKSELEANIETISNDYDKLKQRYKKIVGLVDKITQLTKKEE